MPAWTRAKLAVSGLRAAVIGAAFLIAVSVAMVQSVRLNGLHVSPISITGWIATAGIRAAERDAERLAHRKTKDGYRAAQAEAARLEAERLDRVRTQQEEINDAIESDYRARLAELGARAERLREELRARAQPAGAGRSVESTGFRDAAGRSGEAAGDRGLPAPGQRAGAFGRSEEEQLERDIVATRQALQLDALISWVLEQSRIDPNAKEAD